MGVPSSLKIGDFVDILRGVMDVCVRYNCPIVGGDLSDSIELSLSATAIGEVDRGIALARDGARPGDIVFASRPLGLTPAALAVLNFPPELQHEVIVGDREILWRQFRICDPMFDLSTKLASSGVCTSCIDNTDGFAQSVQEIAERSRVGIVIEAPLELPGVVTRVATVAKQAELELALGPGADFSLVGTIGREFATNSLFAKLGLQKVGYVIEEDGVYVKNGDDIQEFEVHGWNYYAS